METTQKTITEHGDGCCRQRPGNGCIVKYDGGQQTVTTPPGDGTVKLSIVEIVVGRKMNYAVNYGAW